MRGRNKEVRGDRSVDGEIDQMRGRSDGETDGGDGIKTSKQTT